MATKIYQQGYNTVFDDGLTYQTFPSNKTRYVFEGPLYRFYCQDTPNSLYIEVMGLPITQVHNKDGIACATDAQLQQYLNNQLGGISSLPSLFTGPSFTSVVLNDATSTTILALNIERVSYSISNTSSSDVWIKEQPASTDNNKDGEMVWARATASSEMDLKYVGEISAIAVSGTPTIFIKEVSI